MIYIERDNKVLEYYTDDEIEKPIIKILNQVESLVSAETIEDFGVFTFHKDDIDKLRNLMRRDEAMEVEYYEDDDGDDETGKPIIRRFYGCPSCGKTIYSASEFCRDCGQRLKYEKRW